MSCPLLPKTPFILAVDMTDVLVPSTWPFAYQSRLSLEAKHTKLIVKIKEAFYPIKAQVMNCYPIQSFYVLLYQLSKNLLRLYIPRANHDQAEIKLWLNSKRG